MTLRRWPALVALLAAALLTWGALPALAHDVLATSDPQDGDVLDAPPSTVTLVFSGEVKPLGTRIVITGPGGEVQDGTPSVDRMTVTQKLKAGAAPGAYRITWRVTSSDGHPISGVISFTVKGAGTGTPSSTGPVSPSPSTSAGGPVATTASVPSTARPTSAPAPSPEQPSEERWGGWPFVIGAGLLAALAGAFLMLRRRGGHE